MRRLKLFRCMALVVVAAIALIGLTNPVLAQGSGVTIFGVTTSDRLVFFNSANPCAVSTPRKIEGLQVGEQILGIDFRPATGVLYALGSSSRIYTIDLTTAVATPVGAAPFSPALEGTAFGFDFNPVVDRIRIVSNTGQNLRVHPETGVVIVDGRLAYASGDANFGVPPTVAGAAYTNPDRDIATGTTLYDIDVDLHVLATQNPANSGTLQTVGALGVRTNDLLGFDIASVNMLNVGYAAMKLGGGGRGRECGNSTLVQIDLATGRVTELGGIGTAQPITGIAVFIPPPAM
ncbi:MAG: DUF4394 domain-containing protein [Acidobacteria bacterium]|nr:DUF4394 domain-containing protein [Acidobacteriota bacterium]